MTAVLHASLAALWTRSGWRGVLIEGTSGAGKSTLVLRLLRSGWRLAADDRVRVWRSGNALFGRAPDALHGLLEVRGVGVLPAPALRFARVAWVVSHDPAPERVPEPVTRSIAGCAIPALALDLRDATTPERLHALLSSDCASHGFAPVVEGRIKPASFAGPGPL